MNRRIMELKAEAETAIAKLNKAYLDDLPYKTIETIEADANKAVEALNDGYISQQYEDILATEYPMETAIVKMTLTKYSLKKSTAEGTSGVKRADLNDAEEFVDLALLEEKAKTRITVNGQWVYFLERLGMLLAMRTGKEINGGKKYELEGYKISSAAMSCDVEPTLTSTNQIVKQLQRIVDMIIFVDNGEGGNAYKVLKKDAGWLVEVFSKHGKAAQSVSVSNIKTLKYRIVEMLNRMYHDSDYIMEYDRVKSGVAAVRDKAKSAESTESASEGSAEGEPSTDAE